MPRTFLDETVASLTQIEFPTELSMWQRDTLFSPTGRDESLSITTQDFSVAYKDFFPNLIYLGLNPSQFPHM